MTHEVREPHPRFLRNDEGKPLLDLSGNPLRSEESLVRAYSQVYDAYREARVQALTDNRAGGILRAVTMDSHILPSLHQRDREGALYPLAIGLCDLKEFRNVNNEDGHAAGDAAIGLVGDAFMALRENTRPYDLVALVSSLPQNGILPVRTGGDEFTLLQVDINNVYGLAVSADRANRAFVRDHRTLAKERGYTAATWMNFGLAYVPEGKRITDYFPGGPEELLDRTDTMSAQAKALSKRQNDPFVMVYFDLDRREPVPIRVERYQPADVARLERGTFPERGLESAGDILPRVLKRYQGK